MADQLDSIFDGFLAGGTREIDAVEQGLSQVEPSNAEGFNPVGAGEVFDAGVKAGLSGM